MEPSKNFTKRTSDEWRASIRLKTLLAKYGISKEEFDKMKAEHRGLCGICNRKKKLVVDHCHKTGRVRGLLCGKCNSGVGFFEDNPFALMSAVRYAFNGGSWSAGKFSENTINARKELMEILNGGE